MTKSLILASVMALSLGASAMAQEGDTQHLFDVSSRTFKGFGHVDLHLRAASPLSSVIRDAYSVQIRPLSIVPDSDGTDG